ncbi:MAG: CZB domain-containing protein [Rhodospirillum sp.]|nr:CZB domain-containing protein [Rhodospirillum sp.]MCF8489362.1 CZB domain-containing protein [Rhodospirillum sp.]MCF8500718.1 CZB domain-containing protein [Rhodospirillum sp.]
MQNLSIVWRLSLAMLGVAALSTGIMALVFTGYLGDVTDKALERELERYHQTFHARLEAEAFRAQSMAALAGSVPAAAAALAGGDRDALGALYNATFPLLHDTYGVRQFQFHLPPATSFLRVHKPETFGDDLSGFRETVVRTNQTNTPVSGVEKGVAGLGIRGVVPVTNQGSPVGSVEFGMSLDEAFATTFKRDFNVDVVLHLQSETTNGTQNQRDTYQVKASTLGGDSRLTAAQVTAAAAGETILTPSPRAGESLMVMAKAIPDFTGRPAGVVELLIDSSIYQARIDTATRQALIWGLAAVALATLLGSLLALGIARPITVMTNIMDRVAHRDFSVPPPQTNRKDEVGRMARSLAFFMDKSREIAGFEAAQADKFREMEATRAKLTHDAQDNLRGIVSAAIENNEALVVLANMMKDVRDTSEMSQTMASAVEEMVSSINAIAANGDAAAQEAERANQIAQDGVTAANDAVTNMEVIHQSVSGAARTVDTLAEASTQIGEIVQQIEDIADQTNLLALNATIEAARAGDAGKGFAVVAGEVKNLANQTSRATVDIRARIDNLRGEMDVIVRAMREGAEAVDTGRHSISRVGEQLDTISTGIHGITTTMQDMAGLLNQQTHAAREVADGSQRMARMADRNNGEIVTILGQMDQASKVLGERVGVLAALGTAEAIVEVAKNDHVVFKKRVVSSVMGRDTWAASEVPDHHNCRLGEWYDSISDERLTRTPAFQALAVPHKDVHAWGKEALNRAAKGDMEGALKALDSLNDASRAVLVGLDTLSQSLRTNQDG